MDGSPGRKRPPRHPEPSRKPYPRGYREGSIKWDAVRGVWVGKIELPPGPRGERRRHEVSHADARRVEDMMRDALRQRSEASAGTPNLTVKTWVTRWLTAYEPTVTPGVYANANAWASKWIVPAIGGRRLAALTPDDVRRIYTAMREAKNAEGETVPRSETTVHHVAVLTRQILRAARKEGLYVPEEVLLMDLPAMAVVPRTEVPAEPLHQLLEYFAGDPGAVARVQLQASLGLRSGELCGLQWGRMDPAARTVDVSWQLRRLPVKERKTVRGVETIAYRVQPGKEAIQIDAGLHLTRPKTSRSIRLLPLSDAVLAALDAWEKIAPENDWDLVFTSQIKDRHRPTIIDGDPAGPLTGRGTPRRVIASYETRLGPVDPARWREQWYAAQVELGITRPDGKPYAVHQLRHTAATRLLGSGPEIATAILGHSSIVVTRGYQHLPVEAAREALNRAERAASPLPAEKRRWR